jgi:hypothetical protein
MMHNLPKVIVIGALVLVALMFGLPMLSGPPRTTVSPPVPANEATRVSVVATTGIPEKPSDVWVIASVGVFQGHVAIEGGTMSIANMPVEAVMHAKLPPEWTGGVGIELGQVTKGVTGDGYVVPGVQVKRTSAVPAAAESRLTVRLAGRFGGLTVIDAVEDHVVTTVGCSARTRT